MQSIHTSIDVDAPAETVWGVLTDFERYDEWNPVTRIEGQAVAGERLVVSPGPEAGRMPTFRPRVLRAAPGEELRWRGKLFVGGLFDGEHAFEIQRLGESSTRLVQSETFEGLLVGPVLRRYGERTEANFRAANEALKRRSESLATGADVEPPAGGSAEAPRTTTGSDENAVA